MPSDSVEPPARFDYDTSQDMKDNLNDLREKIDKIDEQLVRLFNRRARLGQKVAEVKQRDGKPVYHPDRENEILARVAERNEGPLLDPALQNIFREIFSATRSVERELKIASLGGAGSYSHLASLKLFGHSAVHLLEPNFNDVFAAVEKGRADYGVVPVENSIEGPVGQTLDLLAKTPLTVYAEFYLSIKPTLLSKAKNLGAITTLYTHYMPLAQCRTWVAAHLPQAAVVETGSSSAAAALAAKDPKSAAIGSEEAARLYKLRVLATGIEERADNQTRFFVIAQNPPPPGERNKTSLVLSTADSPGALYEIIRPFADAGVNLSKIQSRPDRSGRWEYLFFIDLDGRADEEPVAGCLAAIRARTTRLTILGSYPAADGGVR